MGGSLHNIKKELTIFEYEELVKQIQSAHVALGNCMEYFKYLNKKMEDIHSDIRDASTICSAYKVSDKQIKSFLQEMVEMKWNERLFKDLMKKTIEETVRERLGCDDYD